MSSQRDLTLQTRLAAYHVGDENIQWVNKFGRNIDIDGPEECVWRQGGTFQTNNMFENPTSLQAVSTSIDDDINQLGCESIRVEGLTSWTATNYTTEDVVMTGQTPVNLVNQYVIINRVFVIGYAAAGRGAVLNDGIITIQTPAPGPTVAAYIAAGVGQTEQAVLGIPAGNDAFVTEYYGNALRATATAYNLFLKVSDQTSPNHDCFITKHVLSSEGLTDHEFHPPLYFPGPCVIQVTMTTTQTNVDAVAGFDVIIRKRGGDA